MTCALAVLSELLCEAGIVAIMQRVTAAFEYASPGNDLSLDSVDQSPSFNSSLIAIQAFVVSVHSCGRLACLIIIPGSMDHFWFAGSYRRLPADLEQNMFRLIFD